VLAKVRSRFDVEVVERHDAIDVSRPRDVADAFHEVVAPTYPLFVSPPYTLALATKMAEVAERARLDLLHVHYALPHAISGILAREMSDGNGVRLKIVTTLHGTDITIVGQDRSYLPITRWGIEQSDAVTAVSRYLTEMTVRELGVRRRIETIPNFVDPKRYSPDGASNYARSLVKNGEHAILHISNFRPVKRIADVLKVFDRIRRKFPARLLLIGDGPERSLAERLSRELGFEDRATFLGNVVAVETVLPVAKLLLLPSDAESFGLAALEAMACEVPVVASRVGGLPEVIEHGVSGFLHAPDALDEMAASGVMVLRDCDKHRAIAQAACTRVREEFCAEKIVPMYEDCYQSVVGG